MASTTVQYVGALPPGTAGSVRAVARTTYPDYPIRHAKGGAIAHMVFASVCILGGIVAIVFRFGIYELGTGIWTGLLFLLTGVTGYKSAGPSGQTGCLITSYMVLSIASSLATIVGLSMSSVDVTASTGRDDLGWMGEEATAHIRRIVSASLIISFLCEGVLSIVTAAFCCRGVCCGRSQQTTAYSAVQQPGVVIQPEQPGVRVVVQPQYAPHQQAAYPQSPSQHQLISGYPTPHGQPGCPPPQAYPPPTQPGYPYNQQQYPPPPSQQQYAYQPQQQQAHGYSSQAGQAPYGEKPPPSYSDVVPSAPAPTP